MISEEDKNRARLHLGYGQVQQSATFLLGVPAAVQTAFMAEGAWARILPSAEAMFRKALDQLDVLYEQIFESYANLDAVKVGNIELNTRQHEQLLEKYRFFQGTVANMLQIPVNPFDQRPGVGAGYGGGGGLNVSVQH